jgi:hypothetical protein
VTAGKIIVSPVAGNLVTGVSELVLEIDDLEAAEVLDAVRSACRSSSAGGSARRSGYSLGRGRIGLWRGPQVGIAGGRQERR